MCQYDQKQEVKLNQRHESANPRIIPDLDSLIVAEFSCGEFSTFEQMEKSQRHYTENQNQIQACDEEDEYVSSDDADCYYAVMIEISTQKNESKEFNKTNLCMYIFT